MKRRLITLLMAATLFGGSMGGAAMALHPSHDLPNTPVVPAHQHFINGQRVGPNACEDGMSIQFDHFHFNIHLGKPGFGVFRGDGDGLGLVTSAPCPS